MITVLNILFKVIGWLKDAGVDFVDVGLSLAMPGENIPWAANVMIPWAARVRREKNIPVGTSWMITQAKEANEFIQDGKVDVIFFASTLLANPHWPYRVRGSLKSPTRTLYYPHPMHTGYKTGPNDHNRLRRPGHVTCPHQGDPSW